MSVATVGVRSSTATRRRSVRWSRGVLFAVLIVIAAIFIVPLIWLFLGALKTNPELSSYPIHWLPAQAQWVNFKTALTSLDFGKYLRNTVELSTIYCVLTTFTSALTGFGFARLRGWGKNPLFILLLGMTMLPQILTVIPTYVLFSRLSLVYTWWPWVLWGLGANPLFSFLFRQFFSSLPLELEDAAIIDGCGYVRIFWQIFLPLSKPVIATIAIFSFQGVWNDFFTPLIFLSSDNTTLAAALPGGYMDPHGNIVPNVLNAGTVYYVIPMVILFFLAQRYFVQGIVTTGMKG